MVNGLQLLDLLRETENKMLHLHRAIDRITNEPDFKESVSVLTEVVRDYQLQLDKNRRWAKSRLASNTPLNSPPTSRPSLVVKNM